MFEILICRLRFACCRSLLESLASDFGEIPQCPSDSGAKQKFVHELCAQAGASFVLSDVSLRQAVTDTALSD